MADISHLVKAAMQQHKQAEAEKERQENMAKYERQAKAEQELMQNLEEVLTPEFRAGVKLFFRRQTDYDSSVFFPYLGVNWHIQGKEDEWIIYTTHDKAFAYRENMGNEITDNELQSTLLLQIGLYQERLEAQEKS